MSTFLRLMLITMILFLQHDHAAVSSSYNAAATKHLSPAMQKIALFQFKLSLTINNNASSFKDCNTYLSIAPNPKTMNWSMSSDCCSWDGVLCDLMTRDVIGLDLSCSQLVGPIPPNSTLFQLSHLQSLNFGYNDLHGVLPGEIFHLHNLKQLHVSYNSNLTVSLPKVRWGCSSSLQILNLAKINLSGGIPDSIGYLKLLTVFQILQCNLSGPIPNSIGNLTQLIVLNLSFNNLSGHIPESLANIQNLEVLSLGDNNFSGPIPRSIGNLTELMLLDLHLNHFSGQILDYLANLQNLVGLYLSDNNFIGSFPSWIYHHSQLTTISLSNNKLTGQLFEFDSSKSRLQSFDCSKNALNGTIPQTFSQLKNLTSLDFSSNNFSGVLNIDVFSSLEYLDNLDLSHNSLLVKITSTAKLTPNLQKLGLSSCKILNFPHFIRSFKKLRYLDLSNNRIDGEIPQWIGSMGKDFLYYLNLSSNSLTGGLEHVPFNNINYLDVQSNMLQGSLPTSICNSSSLQILNLSHNNLSGVIPTCQTSLNYSLSVLDLRMNSIEGSLPSTLSNFHELRSLNLHGNKLKGRIPLSFSGFDYLEVLDLGSNQINDMFPQCLEALPSLQVLVLKSNKFHGFIKSNSKIDHPFPSLRIIDLSCNDFSGLLPAKYIKNFNAMMNVNANNRELNYMGDSFYRDSISVVIKGLEFDIVRILTVLTTIDLSRNKFEGDIPRHIGNLVSLRYLNLSHNHLTGDIPSLIGKLSMLESLDLSSNELVGEIPQQLTDIYSLSVLNLSQNQLSGHIPKGYQFDTFENDSYAGNSGLCGAPLSKKCEKEVIEMQQEEDEDDDDDYFFNGFTWKAVVIGYGSGMVVGFAVGYMMFMAGEPKWFTGIVARELGRKVKRMEIRRFL